MGVSELIYHKSLLLVVLAYILLFCINIYFELKDFFRFSSRKNSYFLTLQEFSFYKQMCLDSKQYDPEDPELPLYRCDFSNGELASLAGERLK